jgi:sortase A
MKRCGADDIASRRRRRAARALLLVLAALLLGHTGYLQAKALLAQVLLEQAWRRSDAGRIKAKPWPWADTRPVARLQVAALKVDLIVLAGDSGRTLAFGPAWNEASALPGQAGASIVSGHRDTHFAFLRELQIGERIEIEHAGEHLHYRVSGTRVVDARTTRLVTTDDGERLLLVTCWPFDDWVAGGPLRYVVEAQRR